MPCELDPKLVLDTVACSAAIGAVLGFILGVVFAFWMTARSLRSKHGDHVLRVGMFLRNTRGRVRTEVRSNETSHERSN